MCPSWLLLLVILILLCVLYTGGSKLATDHFKNYEKIDRTHQWAYLNLWFPRYEWHEKGKRLISTPHFLVDGPRLIGQGYRRLDDVAPDRILSGDSTFKSVEGIIAECKQDGLNCHNIIHDKRTGQNYVNAFSTSDKLVSAPGYVTYIREYPNKNPLTGHMYRMGTRIN